MFRIIKLFFRGKNFKWGIGITFMLFSVVLGTLLYIQHLRTDVANLTGSYNQLRERNDNLEIRYNDAVTNHRTEINEMTNMMNRFVSLRQEDTVRIRQLEQQFRGIQDEKIKECLNVVLPDDIIDSLFNN